MQVHELKSWPEQFQASWEGRKSAELRVDDRDYHGGDLLHLHEWIPLVPNASGPVASYTGRDLLMRVTHVQRADPPADEALMNGYVILSVEHVRLVPIIGAEIRIQDLLRERREQVFGDAGE